MIELNKVAVALALTLSLLVPACASEMPSEEPSADGVTAAPSGDEDQGKENIGESRSALRFNACACIVGGRVMNCSGGVCEYSTPTNLQDNYYCAKTDRTFQCTHYQTQYCRETGYPMHSMHCCSGHSRYLGSELYCTAN